MGAKNENPYPRDGAAKKLFAFIKKSQVVTRKQVLEHAMSELGMNERQAMGQMACVLSPRDADQCKGECRGNVSSYGHLYYIEKLPKKVKGEAQKFRLRWRKTPLEPLKPMAKTEKVVAEKVEKVAEVAKSTEAQTESTDA